jgi:hypothetical protein
MHRDERGWLVNTPSASNEVLVHGRRVRHFMDARGDRARDADAQPDRAAPTILVAGESIAFGYQLPYESSIAALLAEGLGVQVVNVAGVGFAGDEAYERLANALAWFEHPVATITFVVPEAMHRIARPDGWRARSALWTLLARVLPFHTAEAIERTRAVLLDTARVSAAHGARALFVMTNYGPPCLADEQGTPALARELFTGVPGDYLVVDVPPGERVGGIDQHPNEAGARRLSAALASAIRMDGVGRRQEVGRRLHDF